AQSGQDQDGFQVVLAAPPLSDSQRGPSHDLAESMAQALQEAGYEPEVSQESEEDEAASNDSAGSADRQVPSFGSTGDGASEADDTLSEGVVERSDVTTLNFARRPAVQLELGDLGDAEQAAKMSTADAQEQYAEAMTAGVLDWVDGHRGLRPHHCGLLDRGATQRPLSAIAAPWVAQARAERRLVPVRFLGWMGYCP